MTCPRCGKPASGEAGRCAHCGAGFANTTFATGVAPGVAVAIDTTGLPPGASFGPSTGGTAATGEVGATVAPGLGSVDQAGPLHVGQSFGPRYHIIKLLGIGGMGAVYQAWDAELGVAVALKVIRADRQHRAASEAERRFKQELLLARQVTHKHVVRIHDINEIDGIKFITMPFVKGEDLSTLLRRDLKLPVTRALRLARQIAAGMQAAHDAGVVHRDLKPPNIMISGSGTSGDDAEQALIMDFGISASTEEDSSGTIIGTLEYMAPEQAAGKAVDGRADIYAFGLIVYECLLGLRLTTAVLTPAARVEAMKYRVAEGVVPLRTVDRTIPQTLETIVMRCLDRDPAVRYQTTADLVAALDELDENGNRLPIVRRLTKPMVAAAATVVALLLGGTYYTAKRLSAPVKPPDPVAVVIADFQNTTGDKQFDRMLEPQIKRVLEGAGFISAYDHGGIRGIFGVTPPETFDAGAARKFAAAQGVGVVLAGLIERQGNGYDVSVNAVETVSGKVVASGRKTASGKDQVLQAALSLAPAVRKGLGDKSDSAQMFKMASLSATSPDVMRFYAAAREASSSGKFGEARTDYLKALELDPKFGIAYQALAALSYNLGNLQDAAKYAKESLRYLDGMTERERFTTRGTFYMVTGDYPQCVKEYSDLSTRYPAEVLAHNNLALCLTHLRNWPRAIQEQSLAVQMVPTRGLFRTNLALYADYASDFPTGEREGREAQKLRSSVGMIPLAFAQTGQGQLDQAAETYRAFATASALGASVAPSGLGDLAAVQGRYAEAARIFEQGAAADLKAGDNDRAAAKFASLAYVRTAQRQDAAAVAAADKALANSEAPKILFLAGRILAQTGDAARARSLAAKLAAQQQTETQAYAKILEGEVAMKNGDAAAAAKLFADANAAADTWIGHFDLGRAYFEMNSLVPADSEFDRCVKRRGEALALFADEEPTYAFIPAAYYYQGRVRESLNTQSYADSYRAYLALRGNSTEDPIVPDARRRAGK